MLDKKSEDLSSGEAAENNKNETVKNENLESEIVKNEVENVSHKSTTVAEEKAQEAVADNEVKSEASEEKVVKNKSVIEIKEEIIQEDMISSDEVEKEHSEEIVTQNSSESESEDNIKETALKTEEKIPEKETQKQVIPEIDFSVLSLEHLADILEKLLQNHHVNDLKEQFQEIKTNFNLKFNALLAEKKEEYINEGGNEIDFNFTSPVKGKFGSLVKEYKRKQQAIFKAIESEQKQNLERRLELIDELKNLIDNADASTMYKNFKMMQDEWRKVGQIPHTKYNDVWQTYHHHVERFYDLLHLNNDFRDLDFKHNLEVKTKLVEKAEELAEDKDVNHSFKELQILHRMWKEDIGPVAREMREEIWNRFSEATKKIHNKRHELQNQLEAKYDKNVDLKIAVINKMNAINIDSIDSHKLWQDTINQLEVLREEFFAIGSVPKAKNEEVWQMFKEVTRKFNKAKNIFYKSVKNDQTDNLAKKMALVEQAESLQDSDDFDAVTEVFKKIQSDWKTIGHVPRKDSDKIWKRFKDACNHYFDRLHNKMDSATKGKLEVVAQKKDLLDQFKDQINKEDDLTLDLVNSYVEEWKNLGAVPVNMRHLDSKFNKVMDAAYKKLNLDKNEVALMKFKNIIDIYLAQNDVRKIDNEQLFVRRKIDEITKEIKQLENNISFISNASADNPLVRNVYKTIENHNEELLSWQKKLSYLMSLDY